MRTRTVALALALLFGASAMVEAKSQPRAAKAQKYKGKKYKAKKFKAQKYKGTKFKQPKR